MRVDNWKCRVCERDYSQTCVACGGQIPNPSVFGGDICYSPLWSDDADEIYAGSQRVLGLEDPTIDFVICRACFARMNMPSPLMFLEKWIEEDSELVSREECLRVLDRAAGRNIDGSSTGSEG